MAVVDGEAVVNGDVVDQASGENWTIWRGDCIDVLAAMPEASVHYGIYSPPFQSLYTFSDDPRDLSNCRDDPTFWDHYGFVIREMLRVTKPGRCCSVHCMILPTSKTRDGFIGLRDFRGEIIRAHQEAGWIFHSEVAIRKDPVVAMQRSKSIGLLHKQIVKDSTMSRMAVADYVVTMRKPGENPEPVSGPFDRYYGNEAEPDAPLRAGSGERGNEIVRPGDPWYSVAVWQRYAEPCWMDIVQGDVLSRTAARAEEDERHISPLQLTVIRRCLDLWSNPGDTVIDPFAGIGSAGHVAIEMGRRFVGAELKESYYRQAVDNLRAAERQAGSTDLLKLMAAR